MQSDAGELCLCVLCSATYLAENKYFILFSIRCLRNETGWFCIFLVRNRQDVFLVIYKTSCDIPTSFHLPLPVLYKTNSHLASLCCSPCDINYWKETCTCFCRCSLKRCQFIFICMFSTLFMVSDGSYFMQFSECLSQENLEI